MTVVWVYEFKDGTKLKLLDIGFSIAELYKLKELHGDCSVSCKSQI